MSTINAQSDPDFLKWLSTRLVVDQALEPGDPLYEPLFENNPGDPIALIHDDITFSEVESLNFISGFRGAGKTTELFRLRKLLQDEGCFVAYANALDYILPSEPVAISDFLIVLAGSFSDALEKELNFDPAKEGWWPRFVHYLTTTKVKLDGFEVKAGAKAASVEAGLNLKASMKETPSFRQKLRDAMEPRFGELRLEVQKFFDESIKKAKKKSKTTKSIVFIFDQLEQLRDTLGPESPVAESMTSLIANHRDDLRIPNVHCVFTVPPWLKFKLRGFGPRLLYNVKLWNNDFTRSTNPEGLNTLRSIVKRRFTDDGMRRFFGDMQPDGSSVLADQLIQASGGHFRDLIRLLRESLLRCRKKIPINAAIANASISTLRSSFLPIPVKDAVWLNEIGQIRKSLLQDDSAASIRQMTSFLDTHCVTIHLNGQEWYDVHPIIRDELPEIIKREHASPSNVTMK